MQKKTSTGAPTQIVKRGGAVVPYDEQKIERAVTRAMKAAHEYDAEKTLMIAQSVTETLAHKKTHDAEYIPTVEEVQDYVEQALMRYGCTATAKAYILYRAEHTRVREQFGDVPAHVQALASESKKYFKDNPMGEFIYLRTYARWIEQEKRRETWIETVSRYVAFMRENLGDLLREEEYQEVKSAILNQEVMPSMRLMQFAGDPARRCNTCAYNCSFIAPSAIRDFGEIMYLSMQGCGVGFSVESQNVEQLPQIQKQRGAPTATHVVTDSKEGWCDALIAGLTTWYEGGDMTFDFSLIRPQGARLKTMGGKASGPEPLRALLEFARERILKRQGRRLRSIDVHDIICKIGECVVSGGVRRTAMISLSDLDDTEMRDAKKGQFYVSQPHRSVANNSAVYTTAPESTALLNEWIALMQSGSGERGIFNRGSLHKTLPTRRMRYFKKVGFLAPDGSVDASIGTNPCGEIILQSKQFCNLTEIVARYDDTAETLLKKARIASIIGTYQSTLTSFEYISDEWKQHCEEERLLGVSITGQWDSPAAREPETLEMIRDTAVTVNAEYAKRFAISPSLAVTAVKPSGTVSQLLNASSGIHPRHAPYYIRRVRISATDSLFKMLKEQGIPYVPEVGQSEDTATTYVLEFPIKAPDNAKCKDDFTALEQLEYWRRIKEHFTEHNPSATISVGENEWIAVVDWIQKHWDMVGGLSFLPRFDHVYQRAPYETISKERYEELVAAFPIIDYTKLMKYERADETDQKRELACMGGLCEVDALPAETSVQG